jgi:hypothetical protein
MPDEDSLGLAIPAKGKRSVKGACREV